MNKERSYFDRATGGEGDWKTFDAEMQSDFDIERALAERREAEHRLPALRYFNEHFPDPKPPA